MSNATTKLAVNTFVMGLITENSKKAYLEEIKILENCYQENNLLLNFSKTKKLIADSEECEPFLVPWCSHHAVPFMVLSH